MAFDLVGKAVKNLRLPTVDYNNSPIKIIPAQAGDINSRYFSVTLYDDRGDISLKNYTKATLNATLPNGGLQLTEGEIDKVNNCAVCKIAGSMLSQLGKVSCDIQFTGNDASGTATSLTSQTFYVFVAKSQAGDYAIEGSDDYTLLVQLLNEVSGLEENVETAEEERVAAEQARVTAENTRASAESTRTANETARQTAEEERVAAEQARKNELDEIKADLTDKVPKKDYAPETKTESMTQPVGKDENGKLWTAPGQVSSVSSVNGKTGAVVLTAGDVHAMPDNIVIPTVPEKVSAFENDAGYLTEHQDISGKLDAAKLPEAIDDALARAKASGEFNGANGITPTIGANGNWYLGDTDTGKPSRGANGYTPVKGVDYFTDADKTELVNDVLAALPAWEGGSY